MKLAVFLYLEIKWSMPKIHKRVGENNLIISKHFIYEKTIVLSNCSSHNVAGRFLHKPGRGEDIAGEEAEPEDVQNE